MAEFKDIIEGAHKICVFTLCNTCKTKYPCIYKVCNSEVDLRNNLENLVGMEAEVLKFLEDNHTTVYPTWLEWLRNNLSKPIPEEIAKMLGVEPVKEGK